MIVRRAKRIDIPGINSLLAGYGMHPIDASFINHRDVPIIATDGNQTVGFLWMGLMRQNKEAYLDYFCVDKNYSRKKVGNMIAHKALEYAVRLGVEKCYGYIANTAYHDKSAMNALKMALASDGKVYTQVGGQIRHVISELKGAL